MKWIASRFCLLVERLPAAGTISTSTVGVCGEVLSSERSGFKSVIIYVPRIGLHGQTAVSTPAVHFSSVTVPTHYNNLFRVKKKTLVSPGVVRKYLFKKNG